MTKRLAILFLFLLCTTMLVPKTSRESQGAGAETGDLRTDLQRMHVLLSQMQKNAAFVSRGDTPLKHEFELEIEMWQLLLQDMDKKASETVSR